MITNVHTHKEQVMQLLLFLVLTFPYSAYGQADSNHELQNNDADSTWKGSICRRLKAVVDEIDTSDYFTGICIYDLTDDSLIYSYNAQKRLRPASTQKLLTAISALDILGAGHNYTTSVYSTGTIDPDTLLHGSVLNGNIYIIGDFDPKLDDSHITMIATSIKDLGINRINGMLVADVSMKDSLKLGNGWCWDDEQPYLTPLGLGGKSYLYNQKQDSRFSPTTEFLTKLMMRLRSDSIMTNGCGIGDYPATNTGFLICKIQHSIGDILMRMMKESDNLYAESMFYQLASSSKKRIGWKDCEGVIETVMRKAGIQSDDFRIADGSGLSLYNYITPKAEVLLLRYAYSHNNRVFVSLYETLPVAGVDGTLKGRMKNGHTFNNVHAKTGSVSGVSSLAGYLTAPNGHLMAFSIICNGVRKMADGRELQDRICHILCE